MRRTFAIRTKRKTPPVGSEEVKSLHRGKNSLQLYACVEAANGRPAKSKRSYKSMTSKKLQDASVAWVKKVPSPQEFGFGLILEPTYKKAVKG